MAKTVLITGASRGIGRAAAILAGKEGWSVGVNYANDAKSAAEVVELIKKDGGQAIAIKGNVAIEADVIAMFDAAEKAFGPLDAVVANAGVLAKAMPLAEMTLDRFKRIFDINVLGTYLTAREAVRRMSTKHGGKGGALIFMSSAAARLGSPGELVDYAGSKGAVDTLTLALAKEVGREGIRVTGIRPGIIDTDIHEDAGSRERVERLGKTTPFGRHGTPEEVAEAVVWLMSDKASYVSGTIIDVSGGR
jgi:NAD(P)-dependent dehydrogenase (short-subunit alcohol dehydrogenase family)